MSGRKAERGGEVTEGRREGTEGGRKAVGAGEGGRKQVAVAGMTGTGGNGRGPGAALSSAQRLPPARCWGAVIVLLYCNDRKRKQGLVGKGEGEPLPTHPCLAKDMAVSAGHVMPFYPSDLFT